MKSNYRIDVGGEVMTATLLPVEFFQLITCLKLRFSKVLFSVFDTEEKTWTCFQSTEVEPVKTTIRRRK